MNQIAIGVYVHAEPHRLHATLESVRARTSVPYQFVLLPDGPDATTRQALLQYDDLPQLATAQPRGTAACFNRLAACTEADVLVLLESGTTVGPQWLERLLTALAADPRNGLAGPSTNHCWNEQGVYPQARSTPHGIERTAHEADRRFGAQAQTLEPLYSLADFCYVVRRAVIAAIGGADENYALGPCWEMDYNLRAARAGWRGVWVGGAYVHRAPFTARRRHEEARRFTASRRLYQDKFCGGHLRSEKADYRQHCRGDACENFAPPGLIELFHPLPAFEPELHAAPAPRPVPQPALALPEARDADAATSISSAPQEPRATSVVEAPWVTCIMPTADRRSFVLQAIRCFLRQDYPQCELLIVDDGADAVGDCVPQHERIRYVRCEEKRKLGAKRNYACEQARGEIIVHWDDDDWYPSWRISRQVAALLEQGADVCGTSRLFYFDAVAERAWEYRYLTRGAAWVGGNTLAYRKSFWQRNRFADLQVGEDTRFVWARAHKKVADLADPQLCVASVHHGNTSPKQTSNSYWHPLPLARIHDLLGDDRHFYRVGSAQVARTTPSTTWPLISCIMPTYNRRRFLPLAWQSFSQQDYPHKELIIVDDGTDSIADLAAHWPGVNYVALSRRASIGAKRNLACEQARGEIIVHWDDDDWYAPDRLRYQAAPLLAGEADLTGLINSCVLDLSQGQFWTTHERLHRRMFVGDVHGGTLAYHKRVRANGLRYPEINLAEDARLLQQALNAGHRLVRLNNPGVFIYVRHGDNAWKQCKPGRFLQPKEWHPIPPPATFSQTLLADYLAAVG